MTIHNDDHMCPRLIETLNIAENSDFLLSSSFLSYPELTILFTAKAASINVPERREGDVRTALQNG